jgi:UDP-3-O-[3-hydroxymyristoyl] glucosamine N-acyltransferase
MIHETAIVGERVKLGSNVTVGAFTIIENETQIGDDSVIGSHCHIGYANSPQQAAKLMIGKRAVIRSHSVLYSGSVFGDDLTTGHRVTIREQTIANDGLQVGTLSDIQGHCSIGRYCKFHSNVHIGRQSSIDDYVWIFPYVVLTNDPHPPQRVSDRMHHSEICRYCDNERSVTWRYGWRRCSDWGANTGS